MKVEIDGNAGFCGGVIKAIATAEKYLDETGEGQLFSLGEIVHNEEELQRLSAKGLCPRTFDELLSEEEASGRTVLVRAHGIAPSARKAIADKGYRIIDCTCPVVLNIQKQIREAKGRVLIFGKHGHPEVLGLVGQTDGAAVFDNREQLEAILQTIGPDESVEVFSQTTMSPDGYSEACGLITKTLTNAVIHDTICRQVASRHRELSHFAASHDVIVFVSGSHSSNGKVLGDLCASVNPCTHVIGDADALQPSWFESAGSVGVSGATSTPRWLLEEVAGKIENLQ